ncbi:MAG: hypothetical protein LQ345_003521 [Seirophora villosa]|nr:MAG: hypothetical protein LQ345_003521 [Seirophora villosa]
MASIDRINQASSTALTILGCGTLGSAILIGLLSATPKAIDQEQSNASSVEETHANGKDLPKPTRFIACVRSSDSAERLRSDLASLRPPPPVMILQGENARAVQAADTILLACQPQDLTSCIGEPAVTDALRGKLIISILAGVTIPQIERVLGHRTPAKSAAQVNGTHSRSTRPTSIIRAMPNTASFVRSSTTVMTPCPNATPSDIRLVAWLFTAIGTVTQITAAQFDACTALCGSTPAFFALFVESLLDGAVAMGLKRSEAQTMAAETMKGAAMLILAGEQPEAVKEKVATPGGSTIQGLLELERKALRGTVADALIRCTAAASILGDKQA